MKCMFCRKVVKEGDVGSSIDKKAVFLGNKLICTNCLRSLSILLKEIEISAKTSKL